MSNHKHLTLSDRLSLEKGLDNNASRSSLGRVLNKDKSTICKEIKSHARMIPFSRSGVPSSGTYDCIFISECGYNGFCPHACPKRVPVPCRRKDPPSGVCNGCPDRSSCKLTKKIYSAETAQEEYEFELRDSRIGWNISYKEAETLAVILKPLLEQGQSIAHILMNHPEIPYSEKTIYTYIDEGVLREFGITNMDLRRKVGRRMSKKQRQVYKPRRDNRYLKGRTYLDYQNYMAEHSDASVVEMDTVYNDISRGPFIQTFQFVDCHFMKGIYHDTKTSEDMLRGIHNLYEDLGKQNFRKYVQVILTDRGSEFVRAEEIEAFGCKVFYCDSMASWQKPHVENNHILFRYVCPKERDLGKLGLLSQDDLDLIFSHVNSYRRQYLHGKSPYEIFEFFHSDEDIMKRLNMKKIDPDQINLTPDLLKK